MAEEFQAEVCGGNWWSSPIATFNANANSSFMGSYGGCCQNNFMNMKTRSADESSGCCGTAILPDSASQLMGSSPSTTTNIWYQALLVNGRTGESFGQTLPEILNGLPNSGQNSSNFGMDQDQASNFITNSSDCTGDFGGNSYGYPSSLLQTLFDGASSPPPPPAAAYDIQANSLNNFDPVPSMTFLCNPSALDINRAGFFSSKQAYEEKTKCPNIKSRNDEIGDNMGSSVKKSSSESTFKRPRLETPSPLPTFKVRKEKLGDRVTALQQLVSPFGKTDTASVLHEASEYIKLLHDQVNLLSSPYMKNGANMQVQQISDNVEDNSEGIKLQDLRSRGLCLVPVSSTFPVANDAAPDYWTSGFRSTF